MSTNQSPLEIGEFVIQDYVEGQNGYFVHMEIFTLDVKVGERRHQPDPWKAAVTEDEICEIELRITALNPEEPLIKIDALFSQTKMILDSIEPYLPLFRHPKARQGLKRGDRLPPGKNAEAISLFMKKHLIEGRTL